ncbi:MAG: hypothetical protein IIT39_14915 [Clostridia bacterium]|nr:hypothetical protein [Clostridia bacterium]
MLFYTLNNLLLILWAWLFCRRKPSKNKTVFFIIISFSQLLALMVIRNHIGYDYNMYTVGFN